MIKRLEFGGGAHPPVLLLMLMRERNDDNVPKCLATGRAKDGIRPRGVDDESRTDSNSSKSGLAESRVEPVVPLLQ